MMDTVKSQDDNIWAEGMNIIGRLEQSGYRAYLVGGCVRDRMLGRSLHDIDIATSATPEEVMALFSRTLPTGLKHGTVTVMENGRSFEITTFRQETGYTDARRPDQISFVLDVREDLARRDFTFNAMAIGVDGEIVDPFGGQDALRAGVVDCVGDASERFGEDALRMLRAIRFAAEFEFVLLPDVWQSIVKHRSKLKQVALERVSAEWDKMMAGSGPEQACHYLFKSGLLVNVKEPLPDSFQQAAERYRFNELPWEWDVWGTAATDEGTMGNMLQLPLISDADLRWAALIAGIGMSEEDCTALCRTLRISGRRAARIAGVAGFNEKLGYYDDHSLRVGWIRTVLAYGRSIAEDWLTVNEVCDPDSSAKEKTLWLNELSVTSVQELAVKGDELCSYLGRSPGPWIAALLQQLLEEVALGGIPNDKGSLLWAAKESIGNQR
ncbi:CCA tRNA nucleotidyltransferase [Cohnella luojiensis]|uniref:CCA tRNA nucleotidyltransferase n=1 Tax=Cohnella luojiensis TaxID=652876 RepID=A0A4Y8M5I7_9BACL|nr:CCA tRNA nucleotidyltransferase [Cohnella luojiensis]TFE30032.1 CCA tRNA nucleotidyltransferase [Cohnella luojiensis]